MSSSWAVVHRAPLHAAFVAVDSAATRAGLCASDVVLRLIRVAEAEGLWDVLRVAGLRPLIVVQVRLRLPHLLRCTFSWHATAQEPATALPTRCLYIVPRNGRDAWYALPAGSIVQTTVLTRRVQDASAVASPSPHERRTCSGCLAEGAAPVADAGRTTLRFLWRSPRPGAVPSRLRRRRLCGAARRHMRQRYRPPARPHG